MAGALGTRRLKSQRVDVRTRRNTMHPYLLLTIALVVSACGASKDSAAARSTSPAPLPTSVASIGPTTVAFEPLAAVKSYEGALDNLYLNAATPLDSFHAVAVTPDFAIETSAVARFREHGYRQVGRRTVVTATLVGGSSVGSVPNGAMQVTSCIDVRAVRGLDKNGTSIVAADRKPYLVGQLTFMSSTSGGATSWKVSQTRNEQATSCPA